MNCVEPLEARIAPAVILGIDSQNHLLRFDSASPGAVTTIDITGLVGTGGAEFIKGIDFRPATGELYALGITQVPGNGNDEGRIYTIDPFTGLATAVSTTPFATNLADSADWAFDVNPVADRLRIVNDFDANYRVHPDTGALVLRDTDISGASFDIIGTAYDRNFINGGTTTLFAIDYLANSLVRIGGTGGTPSPNGGAVTTIGPLGVNVDSFRAGFDIESRTGTAYAALSVDGVTGLYTIDLATGAAAPLGAIGAIGGNPLLHGITVALPRDLVAPPGGKVITFTDLDGDKVTVTSSRSALAPGDFTFATGQFGSQLLRFQVPESDVLLFEGASLSFTAAPQGGHGDGFVNIGAIEANGSKLGKVTVDGDLGHIVAGSGGLNATGVGLGSLTVHSLGALGTSTQLAGGSLVSMLVGKVGAVTVLTDMLGAKLQSIGIDQGIGSISIGGDLVGGDVGGTAAGFFTGGAIGHVTIGGSFVGGVNIDDGAIVGGSIGKVTIGGSVLGGSGEMSGRILSKSTIGAISIKGDLVGSSGANSGLLYAQGDIASVTLGGSLLGGTVLDAGDERLSGAIQAEGSILGGVKIRGDIVGGNSSGSGVVETQAGRLGAVTVGGSVTGFVDSAGTIFGGSGLASVKIGGDLRSGPNLEFAGSVGSREAVGAVTIGGSVIGGVISGRTLGAVRIGGDLRAVAVGDFVEIRAFGVPDSAALSLKSVSVKGSVVQARIFAGQGAAPGLPAIPAEADASIGAVTVGGDWVASSILAGVNLGADMRPGTADDTKVAEAIDAIFSTIKSVTIGGFVMGTVAGGDHFGFVAEKIDALKIGGVKVPLTAGLEKAGFALGATGDVRVREIDTTPAVFTDPTPPATANPLIYILDGANQLLTLRADAPGTILSTTTITGVGAGEQIEAIDFRPATGELYALGLTAADSGTDVVRVLRLNIATGAATPEVTLDFAGNTGEHYGFDFDPATDRLRIVSDGDLNLSYEPATASVTFGTNLNDPDGEEQIFAAAYDRSYRGAPASTLYGIDYAGARLVRIGGVDGAPSANGGVVTPIGALIPGAGQILGNRIGGFDIEARTGVGYAVLFNTNSDTGLLRIDLATGAASSLGLIDTAGGIYRGLAIAPPAPDFVGPTSGKTISFLDVDGDLVTVKTSRGTLEAGDFIFAGTSLVGSQLARFNANLIDGADLTFTATPFGGRGDGFVNVGAIVTGGALGKVTIDGDLGRISALDVKALTAHSMGRFGTSTQFSGDDLVSTFTKGLGALTLRTDLVNAGLNAEATGGVGGIGKVTLGGSLIGGGGLNEGRIFSQTTIGDVKLGGSIVGGAGTNSASIIADTTIGKVTIGGSIVGGSGSLSSRIVAIKSTGGIGAIAIKGALSGGPGDISGEIAAGGTIASVSIGGSISSWAVAGGGNQGNGDIYAGGAIGAVKIGGSIRGGLTIYGGTIFSDETIGAVTIGGSLVASSGDRSGSIYAGTGIASVKIAGDLRGGDGLRTGLRIFDQGTIGKVTIGGSLVGGSNNVNGIFSVDFIDAVSIGGSIRATGGPGTVTIAAGGIEDGFAGLKSLTVKGGVRGAFIAAGFQIDRTPDSPDATIGAVSIGGNLQATSIVAGAIPGVDGLYGTADDAKAPGEAAPDLLFSRLASVLVKGFAAGTPDTNGDQFGIVAEQIDKLQIGAYKAPLTTGKDTAGLALSADLHAREV